MNGFENHEDLLVSRNFMNFGPQTAKSRTFVFTHPHKCSMLLLFQPSQWEVTEQNSTKLCDMLGTEPD